MKALVAAVAVVVLAVPVQSFACGGAEMAAAEKSVNIEKVDVKKVVELQKAAAVYVLDANGEKTRSEQGVIPGAKLLSSAASYDVVKELPLMKEAQLVFYCANEKCRASTIAAERAAKAGFSNVAVLPAGISGWKAAGQKTVRPSI